MKKIWLVIGLVAIALIAAVAALKFLWDARVDYDALQVDRDALKKELDDVEEIEEEVEYIPPGGKPNPTVEPLPNEK